MDEIDQTVILLIAIYSTYNVVQWSQIHNYCPIPLASIWYDTPKKGNSYVDGSIFDANGKLNTTSRYQPYVVRLLK